MSAMSELDAEVQTAKVIHIDDWAQRLALKQRLAISSLVTRLESAPILITEEYWSEILGDVKTVKEQFGV